MSTFTSIASPLTPASSPPPASHSSSASPGPAALPSPNCNRNSCSTPPPPPTSPVPVFAPRPLRFPSSNYFPQQRTLLVLQEEQQPPLALNRTPSPGSRKNSLSSPVSFLAGGGGGKQRRSRSSSIASITTGVESNPLLSKESPTTLGDGEHLVRLYSPSHDVLDDFLKLVQNGNLPRSRNSPLSFREVFGTVSSTSIHHHQHSRKPSSGSDRIVISRGIAPSPISRTLTRNPIIHNSQFGYVKEES